MSSVKSSTPNDRFNFRNIEKSKPVENQQIGIKKYNSSVKRIAAYIFGKRFTLKDGDKTFYLNKKSAVKFIQRIQNQDNNFNDAVEQVKSTAKRDLEAFSGDQIRQVFLEYMRLEDKNDLPKAKIGEEPNSSISKNKTSKPPLITQEAFSKLTVSQIRELSADKVIECFNAGYYHEKIKFFKSEANRFTKIHNKKMEDESFRNEKLIPSINQEYGTSFKSDRDLKSFVKLEANNEMALKECFQIAEELSGLSFDTAEKLNLKKDEMNDCYLKVVQRSELNNEEYRNKVLTPLINEKIGTRFKNYDDLASFGLLALTDELAKKGCLQKAKELSGLSFETFEALESKQGEIKKSRSSLIEKLVVDELNSAFSLQCQDPNELVEHLRLFTCDQFKKIDFTQLNPEKLKVKENPFLYLFLLKPEWLAELSLQNRLVLLPHVLSEIRDTPKETLSTYLFECLNAGLPLEGAEVDDLRETFLKSGILEDVKNSLEKLNPKGRELFFEAADDLNFDEVEQLLDDKNFVSENTPYLSFNHLQDALNEKFLTVEHLESSIESGSKEFAYKVLLLKAFANPELDEIQKRVAKTLNTEDISKILMKKESRNNDLEWIFELEKNQTKGIDFRSHFEYRNQGFRVVFLEMEQSQFKGKKISSLSKEELNSWMGEVSLNYNNGLVAFEKASALSILKEAFSSLTDVQVQEFDLQTVSQFYSKPLQLAIADFIYCSEKKSESLSDESVEMLKNLFGVDAAPILPKRCLKEMSFDGYSVSQKLLERLHRAKKIRDLSESQADNFLKQAQYYDFSNTSDAKKITDELLSKVSLSAAMNCYIGVLRSEDDEHEGRKILREALSQKLSNLTPGEIQAISFEEVELSSELVFLVFNSPEKWEKMSQQTFDELKMKSYNEPLTLLGEKTAFLSDSFLQEIDFSFPKPRLVFDESTDEMKEVINEEEKKAWLDALQKLHHVNRLGTLTQDQKEQILKEMDLLQEMQDSQAIIDALMGQ